MQMISCYNGFDFVDFDYCGVIVFDVGDFG